MSSAGGIHVHAPSFLVTGALPTVLPVASFDNVRQRVGLGPQQAPQTTLHISPAGTDNPLRIDGLKTTPNNGNNYRILLVDANGVVYRSSANTQGNPSFGGMGGGPSAGAVHALSAGEGITPSTGTTVELGERLQREQARLRAEVEELRQTVEQLRSYIEASRTAATAPSHGH